MAEPRKNLMQPARQNSMDPAGSNRRAAPSRDDTGCTKDELYERARRLRIEGRSTMTKQQLIDALRNR